MLVPLGRGEDGLPNRKKKARDSAIALQLTAPEKRPLIGGIYSAKLLFEFCVFVEGVPSDRRLCEERLILLAAPSAREALRAAKDHGRKSQHRYRNNEGSPVHFRFVGVLDLCHLGSECEPNEVWYALAERLRPMERRNAILPKENELSAFNVERLILGKRS
jgi:uncharacterized protein DUF4288